MLILARKCNEQIVISENIVITVVAIRGGSLDEVVATAHPERYVIHRGALVARSEFRAEVAAIRAGVPA